VKVNAECEITILLISPHIRNRLEQDALKSHLDGIMKEVQNIALFLVQRYNVKVQLGLLYTTQRV